jgi:hypothetical protein
MTSQDGRKKNLKMELQREKIWLVRKDASSDKVLLPRRSIELEFDPGVGLNSNCLCRRSVARARTGTGFGCDLRYLEKDFGRKSTPNTDMKPDKVACNIHTQYT